MPEQVHSIQFQQGEPLVYQRKQPHILPLYRRDWDRIKRMASRIKTPKSICRILGTFALGVLSSSFVAIASVFKQREQHQGEFQTLVYVLLISLFAALLCYTIAFFTKKDTNTRGKELVIEMESIEADFVAPVNSDSGYDI